MLGSRIRERDWKGPAMRLAKPDRDILSRMAGGWRPLKSQIVSGMRLERRGLLRLDWGPDGTPDADKMCWYLTPAAYAALNEQ
jgi:hypothetical protein